MNNIKIKFYTLFGTHYCLAHFSKDNNYITTAPTYHLALLKALKYQELNK